MFLGTYNRRLSPRLDIKLPLNWGDAFRQPETTFDDSDGEQVELRRQLVDLTQVDPQHVDEKAARQLARKIRSTKHYGWQNPYDGRTVLFSIKDDEFGTTGLYSGAKVQALLEKRRKFLSERDLTMDNPMAAEVEDPFRQLLGDADSIPWFELAAEDEPVSVAKSLSLAQSQLSPQARGKKLEDDLIDALTRAGFDVQQRIRLMGAEVDIVVCEWDTSTGPRTILIECKEQSESRQPVRLAPVMRLFGLRTASASFASNSLAVMVSTTGYTTNARRFGRAHGIAMTDHRSLLDHLDRMPVRTQPMLRSAYLDSNDCVRLPGDHARWLGETKLAVMGSVDWVELWGARALQQYQDAHPE